VKIGKIIVLKDSVCWCET